MFEVQNQPPPLEPYNLFASDAVLREAVRRDGASWAEGDLTELGVRLGKPETVQLGFDANKFSPQLHTLDRYGHRLDEVDFHPAWHQLLEIALEAGLHSSPGQIRNRARMWRAPPGPTCWGRLKAACIARSR